MHNAPYGRPAIPQSPLEDEKHRWFRARDAFQRGLWHMSRFGAGGEECKTRRHNAQNKTELQKRYDFSISDVFCIGAK